ncbi:hypothetical protein WA026_016084 [Henosepilachna vigintioctopunctata]|uniref:Protein artemis n=1 Tax=Henosepilachna vigintioctopunctata TaxID=420089 RepID=A0AAW1U8S2_9CUCU
MSSFGGKFKEIPGISVDRFDCNNLNSEAYFLSHCHQDHMVGLDISEFQESLKQRNCFIYVSQVTKAILKQLYPDIGSQIRELDFYNPTTIHLKKNNISVIPIPSAHCPGSVMFLFELENSINILYTGDYRINSNDFRKIKALYNSLGNLKSIYKIYLDTTFFSKSYLQFPSREKSLDEICNLIQEWITKSEKHIVNIKTSARYGYEYVFMEIYRRFRMPVHVNEKAFAFYSLIPDMDESISLDSSKTKIHSSCGSNFMNICLANKKMYPTRVIKMSAMRWKTKDLNNGITSDNQYGTHFVCYSTHASYEEGVELIKFLKPQEIEPCVLSLDDKVNTEMFNTIENLLSCETEPICKRPKLFNIDKIQNEPMKHMEHIHGDSCNDILFESALESPPRIEVLD